MNEFLKIFYSFAGEMKYYKAYEKAEEEFINTNGQRKYKNYNSFKSCLTWYRRHERQKSKSVSIKTVK